MTATAPSACPTGPTSRRALERAVRAAPSGLTTTNSADLTSSPPSAAVLADVTLLDIEVPNLPAPETLEAHGGGLEVVAQSEACDGAAAQLLGAEAQHRAERPVAIAIGAVATREGNADRRLLDGIAEQCVEGLERRKIAGRLERIRVVENRVQGRAFGALH